MSSKAFFWIEKKKDKRKYSQTGIAQKSLPVLRLEKHDLFSMSRMQTPVQVKKTEGHVFPF